MKLILPVTVLAAAFAASTAAAVFAGPPVASPAPAKAAAKKTSFVCPVTNEKIDDISKASGKSVYKGKTYYFCCGGCKPAFDKNPAKFVKAEVAKPAGAKSAAKPAPKKA